MKKENITLSVLNALGLEIEIIYKGELKQGTYSFKWNAEKYDERNLFLQTFGICL